MTQLVFPDNTTLINFALIKRMDLLERLANGNGAWCATVAGECARSSTQPGLEDLAGAPAIFGDPLTPETPAERIDIHNLRTEMALPGEPPWQHLGESESIIIIHRRNLDGIFVTDDVSARRHATREGIKTASTWDLLRLAAKLSFIDRPTLWGYLQTLRTNKRGGPPGVSDNESMNKWIDEGGRNS